MIAFARLFSTSLFLAGAALVAFALYAVLTGPGGSGAGPLLHSGVIRFGIASGLVGSGLVIGLLADIAERLGQRG